jgi:hypothetical protein
LPLGSFSPGVITVFRNCQSWLTSSHARLPLNSRAIGSNKWRNMTASFAFSEKGHCDILGDLGADFVGQVLAKRRPLGRMGGNFASLNARRRGEAAWWIMAE